MKLPSLSLLLKWTFLGTMVIFMAAITYLLADENEPITEGKMNEAKSDLLELRSIFDGDALPATDALTPFAFIMPDFRKLASLSLNEATPFRNDLKSDIQFKDDELVPPLGLAWLTEYTRGISERDRERRIEFEEKSSVGPLEEENERENEERKRRLNLTNNNLNITIFSIRGSFYGDLKYSISSYFLFWFKIGEIETGDFAQVTEVF